MKRAFLPFIGFTIEERRSSKLSGLRKGRNGSIIKKRPTRYASHKDNAIYAYYADLLYQQYEDKLREQDLTDVVIAYRKSQYLHTGKADNIHLAYDVFKEIKKRKNCVALAFDIKSFYDNIDHKKLKEEWIKILGDEAKDGRLPKDHYKIYKTLTDYCYVQRKAIEIYKNCNAPESLHNICETCKTPSKYKMKYKIFEDMNEFHKFKKWYAQHPEIKLWDLADEELKYRDQILSSKRAFNFNIGMLDEEEPYGIPQGSALSALLANIYMIPFDKTMKEYARSLNAIYRRYSDDILFICDKKYEEIATKDIPSMIKERGKHLLIHKINKTDKNSKSKYYDFSAPSIKERPLQYLGLEFDGKNIKIRGSSLARYLRKSKRGVTAMRVSVQNKIRAFWDNGGDMNKITPNMYRKTLYRRYTHLGKRNFLSYAYRAFKHTECKLIKKQVKKHFDRLKEFIQNADKKLNDFYQELKNK